MLRCIKQSDYDTIGDADKPGTSDGLWSQVFQKLLLILTGSLVIIGLICYYYYYNGDSGIITLLNNNNDVIAIDYDSLAYPSMTCTSSSDSDLDANNYDKTLIWQGSPGFFLSGMLSTHSNFHEDRLFAIDYCQVDGFGSYGMFATLPTTRYDEQFEWIRGCGGRTGIYYVQTIHDNKREDRTFEFKCASLPNQLIFDESSCQWSDYLAYYDGKIDCNCPSNGIIRTMQSIHNTFFQDRKFKFECCTVARMANNVDYNYAEMKLVKDDSYSNQYHGTHDNMKEGYFLNGLNSIHDNGEEDRLFKWSYIQQKDAMEDVDEDPGRGNGNSGKGSDGDGYILISLLDRTNYDVTWTRSCNNVNNGDAALIGAYSTFDNYHNDRKWSFTCGLLDRLQYYLVNCGWTGYLNNYDGEINFGCLNNGVIRGIESTHDNFFQDRLYRFECCEIMSLQDPEA